MSTYNMRQIIFPRPRRTQTNDIYNEMMDFFRLNQQQADESGFGEVRTKEAKQDVINKNKEVLEQNRNNLSANQVRDAESKINEQELDLLRMETKEALSIEDIEEGLEKGAKMIKKENTGNPYEYVKLKGNIYNEAMEELNERIENFGKLGLEVQDMETLRDKYEKEKNKYYDIKSGFDQNRKSILNKYTLIYTMASGRVADIEFVVNAEKEGKPDGVRTNVRYNYENGISKLNQNTGMNIRQKDIKSGNLPEDKNISFGFDYFQYTKGVRGQTDEFSIPDQYTFQGDIDTFDYSKLESTGAENRKTGDMLRGSNNMVYYVDKNLDLRPIHSKKTLDTLKRKNKNLIIQDLTPKEEDGLSYLVKEPFDIYKSLEQRQDLEGLASNQLSSETSMELGEKISTRPAWSPALRPEEFQKTRQSFLQPEGESKMASWTKNIWGGILKGGKEILKFKGY